MLRQAARYRLAGTAAAVVLLACGAAAAAVLDAAGAPGRVPARQGRPQGHRPEPVGALFWFRNGHLGPHFCTASVVHSARGNLLITAAHCLAGASVQPPGSVVFAPGYRNSKFPLGIWTVTAVFETAHWSASHDPNDDVAFLTVSRRGTSVERAAGAELLATDYRALPATVQVVGYPDGADQPIDCTTRATAFVTAVLRQLTFTCPGYTNGTSGSPFLYHAPNRAGSGMIIGVIGGYQAGGDTARVSYSAQFLANVAALYRTANGPRQRAADK
jgi:V8-like Glu-specific endopeptidase